MSWFGKKETPAESARKQQREITRAQRTVQRSSAELEREEKKLEADIKRLAKQGETQAVQMLAKQLVALRAQKSRSIATNYRIGSVGAQAKMLSSNSVVAGAIGSVAGVMKATNDQMKPEQIAGILRQFEEESMKMDMKDELIEETLNDVLGDSEDEAEQDLVVNKILDEIGIEVNAKLSKVKAPTNDPAGEMSMADIERLISGPSSSGRQAVKH